MTPAVRSQTSLVQIAPFEAMGALQPGSSIFVGRREERNYVLVHIHSRSFLVLGPLHIGKTSLLNAIYSDLKRSPSGHEGIRSRPILLSLQGITSSSAIVAQLVEICRQAGVNPSTKDTPIKLLRRLGAAYRAQDERAVLIVNEVDGLLLAEPDFFHELNRLHESGDVRFVLGGNVTAREGLGQVNGPLCHFTIGGSGNRYFDLSVLADEDAFELVDKLEAEPLGLSWQESEREEGRRLLVQRSYGVPWAIQGLCMRLVELLDGKRCSVLRLDDAREVAGTTVLLDHFDEKIDLGELVDRKGDLAVRSAGKALLAEVALQRYFTGSAPVHGSCLRDADPSDYSFTSTDAREMLGQAAATWLDTGTSANGHVQDFVQGLDIARLLRGLTLTLIVQEVERPPGGEPDYAFQHHIYPLELARLDGGPKQRVADALEDLARHLATI